MISIDGNVQQDDSKLIKVLLKTTVILQVLQNAENDLGLTEISVRANLNKTTCYRILITLMKDNLVEKGTLPGTYKLGIRLLELGSTVQQKLDLRDRALPALKNLAAVTGETVFLCLLHDQRAVCIERVEGEHVQLLAMKVGDTWPLFLGAAPRILLSSLPDEIIKEILNQLVESKSAYPHLHPEKIKEHIDFIRQEGYSISYEDVTPGVASIGAPIYDHSHSIIGAISLSSISGRINKENENEYAKLTMEAAANISYSMGKA